MALAVIIKDKLRMKYRVVMTSHNLCQKVQHTNFCVFLMGAAIFMVWYGIVEFNVPLDTL